MVWLLTISKSSGDPYKSSEIMMRVKLELVDVAVRFCGDGYKVL